MRFDFTVRRATFVERPNRFLVLARRADGEVVRTHCADPGRLRELLVPGATVYISPAAREGRSTAYDLRFVEHPDNGVLISLDSRLPNALFREAAMDGALDPFPPPVKLKPEVPLPFTGRRVRSRADYVLEDGLSRTWWVEVKSATLVVDGTARFPDAVTERGARHVRELTELVGIGQRAAVCFVIQRPDADALRPEWDRDPAFAAALKVAAEAGVMLCAWTTQVALSGARIVQQVPVFTDP
jgi:sugar fermentation stimulation protein A